jgi:hypothetical protein
LCCVVLCCLVLSCVVLCCVVLCCLVLCCVVLSCLVLSRLVCACFLSYRVLSLSCRLTMVSFVLSFRSWSTSLGGVNIVKGEIHNVLSVRRCYLRGPCLALPGLSLPSLSLLCLSLPCLFLAVPLPYRDVLCCALALPCPRNRCPHG